jgi:spore coat protein CotH
LERALNRSHRPWLLTLLFVAACTRSKPADDTGKDDTGQSESGAGNFDPDHILQVSLTLDEDDWDTLRNQTRTFFTELSGDDCMSEPFESPYTYFSADVVIDGESLDHIGVRKKGFIGSQSSEKPGLKLNLDEFVEGAELFGGDNITLNNGVQDPSLIRQCLSYDLLQQAGLHAPRCNFARVAVNGEDMGIYIHVEPIKRAFLRDRFGSDDGDLYEGTLSDFYAGWTTTFDAKNSDTDETLAPITALTEALESTDSSSQSLEALLSQHIDFDAFVTYWAMETIIAHWDGYAGNRNNFYLYHDPATDLLNFIPWGIDAAFQSASASADPFTTGYLSYRLLEDEDTAAQFEERVLELLDAVWDENALVAEIDRMEDLLATELGNEELAESVEDVRDFVGKRDEALVDKLPGSAAFDATSFCLSELGAIDAVFSTTWGSLETSADITQEGTLDWTMTWGGWEIDFYQAGVVAGLSEGTPLLAIAGVIDPDAGSLVIPYVVFDPDQIELDQPIPVDWNQASGAVLYTDNSLGGELYEIGWLGEGTLEFEAFEATDGAEIIGKLSSPIWGWE